MLTETELTLIEAPLDVVGDHTLGAPAAGRFEPCPAFRGGESCAPVCDDCGWLAEEHEHRAEVRTLPSRRPETRRLAS